MELIWWFNQLVELGGLSKTLRQGVGNSYEAGEMKSFLESCLSGIGKERWVWKNLLQYH